MRRNEERRKHAKRRVWVGEAVNNEQQGEVHCNENHIYVYPEKELRGLSPNVNIHVSVSDIYIPRTGPHIFLQQNRQDDPEKI
jgi:hypothetical protein